MPICEFSSIREILSFIEFSLLRGPLISPTAKRRVITLISSAEEDGGNIILDGRNITHPELYPNGNFVGPTIIQGGTSMNCYQYVFEDLRMKNG